MPVMTYRGSCHCGAIRFEVDMETPKKAVAGNCSICSRTGWLLTFVAADTFVLLSGEDVLRDYQFGKRHIHHLFCSVCGVRAFSRGSDPRSGETVAVNLRCIPALDLASLEVDTFDCAPL